MKTQRNLLLIPAIIALLYGLASVFIPRSFITYFNIPAEMITPGFVAWVVSTGIASIGLSMLAFWMRSLTDASSMKGGMTVFSIFYALFGLETLLEPVIIPEMTLNTTTVIRELHLFFWQLLSSHIESPKKRPNKQ